MTTTKSAGTKPPATRKPATKPATQRTPTKSQTKWQKFWNGIKGVAEWIWKNFFRVAGAILLLIAIVFSCRVVTGKITFKEIQEKTTIVDPINPVDPVDPAEKPPAVKKNLEHTAYWTVATEHSRWPDMSEFDIVAGHSDPNEKGEAKVIFLIGNITEKDLQHTYFNGYKGTWSESVKNQIITEIQDSVRPHVPGFTLSTVEIVHIP